MQDFRRPIVFDLDGTLYLEGVLIPGALKTIAALQAIDYPFVFLTNNSSKTQATYVKQLQALGFNIQAHHMISSLDATLDWLNQRGYRRLVLCATPEVEAACIAAGFTLVRELDAPVVDAVVMTFDTSLTYEKLWLAHEHIQKGAPFISSHPDVVCPRQGQKTMPDAGAFNALLATSTGQSPTVIGKPEAPMVRYLEKILKVPASSLIMVGDRLYTDMKMAHDFGMTGVCVLTGETTAEAIQASTLTPAIVLNSVADLMAYLNL